MKCVNLSEVENQPIYRLYIFHDMIGIKWLLQKVLSMTDEFAMTEIPILL